MILSLNDCLQESPNSTLCILNRKCLTTQLNLSELTTISIPCLVQHVQGEFCLLSDLHRRVISSDKNSGRRIVLKLNKSTSTLSRPPPFVFLLLQRFFFLLSFLGSLVSYQHPEIVPSSARCAPCFRHRHRQ
jgi:hypothetical protein